MKLQPHSTCPQRHSYIKREPGTYARSASVVALQERDPDTRQMKTVGVRCRRCGAIKMNHWATWVTVS